MIENKIKEISEQPDEEVDCSGDYSNIFMEMRGSENESDQDTDESTTSQKFLDL